MSDAANAYLLEDVTFAYGAEPVLDVPRLAVARGAVTALVGANGAGKTTLLHLLGFLAVPRSGRLTFFGETPTPRALLPLRRRVGLMLQHPYLFHDTALANVEWALRLRGVVRGECRRRARAALAEVGIDALERRPARELSGGESRRLALARVLALDAEVLLLDEPLAHMDAESAARTGAAVLARNRERGVTVVLASHDAVRVRALVNETVCLDRGVPVPAVPVNVFRGALVDGGAFFDTGKVRMRVAGAGQGSRLSIDPAAIVLSREPLTSSMRNELGGHIVAAAEEGDRVRVDVDAGERFQVFITAESLRLLNLHVGDEVRLSFKSTAAKVF